MTDRATLYEVGPRDGLQNEAREIPVDNKLRLIAALETSGLSRIEVGSFVSPKWVPQMAGSDEIVRRLSRAPGVLYGVLVPNMTGYNRFREAAGQDFPGEIAIFLSASEGFSRANLNAGIDESLSRAGEVVSAAAADGVTVRGYVSCVTDCPFDGPTAPADVAEVAFRLAALGVREVSLGETIGRGTPERVAAMLAAVAARVPVERLAGHFHDTGGRALDNIRAALAFGVRTFDSAVGGLGGCPYAPGAPGNVATEAVVGLLHKAGFDTGVDPEALAAAAGIAREMRGEV